MPAFDESGAGGRDGGIPAMVPGREKLRELRKSRQEREFGPVRIRLAEYEAKGVFCCLATLLLDAGR